MFGINDIPLLLCLLPSLVISAPAPAPQQAALPAVPDQYNISAAEYRITDAIDPIKGIAGKNNSLSFIVSGVKPGNLPLNCSGVWFHESGNDTGVYTNLNCTDQAMYADVTEYDNGSEAPSVGGHTLILTLQHTTLLPTIWNFTTTDPPWVCEAGGATCILKNWFVLDSLPDAALPSQTFLAALEAVQTDEATEEEKDALREAGKAVEADPADVEALIDLYAAIDAVETDGATEAETDALIQAGAVAEILPESIEAFIESAY
ncbi:MAG: hypothetical protein Q9221_004723 [Calogaya cf. arnoldii]